MPKPKKRIKTQNKIKREFPPGAGKNILKKGMKVENIALNITNKEFLEYEENYRLFDKERSKLEGLSEMMELVIERLYKLDRLDNPLYPSALNFIKSSLDDINSPSYELDILYQKLRLKYEEQNQKSPALS